MSHFIFILLVEALLILLMPLIVLMVLNWKKKKKDAADIERLLAQVEESDTKRKKHLVKYLTSQLSMEEQPSIELVEDLIAVEKRFTQQFLEIQLNQQSISDFYQHSCEFVDKYLRLIAENVPKPIDNTLDITGETLPEEQVDANNSEEIEEAKKEGDVEDVGPETIDSNPEESDSSEVKEIEPKIADEKASENLESNKADQTSSSEPEPKEETNNLEAEEDEFGAEEPDWGDAFAEAGVEMKDPISEENEKN